MDQKQLLVGADKTGAVNLYEQIGDNRPTPVSVQCGTWNTWVAAVELLGASPGEMLSVQLSRKDSQFLPLDEGVVFSAHNHILAAFRVLGAICREKLGCGFIVRIENDNGDFIYVDSRLSDRSFVKFIELDFVARSGDLPRFVPKPPSVHPECHDTPESLRPFYMET